MIRRRRRRNSDIAFGLDSFLDVIANVIGIIIRMIIVVWVGAKSYHTLQMEKTDPQSAKHEVIMQQARTDDLLGDELKQHKEQLAKAKEELSRHLEKLTENRNSVQRLQDQRDNLQQKVLTVVTDQNQIEKKLKPLQYTAQKADITMAQLQERIDKLKGNLEAVKENFPKAKVHHFHTPVSRSVSGEELFFELRDNRVSFIDINGFLDDIRFNLEDDAKLLKDRARIEKTTQQIGYFRLRYSLARQNDVLDILNANQGMAGEHFRYGLEEWTVQPVQEQRGETLEQALRRVSSFRTQVDFVDPRKTVVTFWVYPDSFALFRELRDYLYERNIEVAGRPLPDGIPIRANRSGTRSRGQ